MQKNMPPKKRAKVVVDATPQSPHVSDNESDGEETRVEEMDRAPTEHGQHAAEKKSKKNTHVALDEKIEEELLEWYQANSCLYNKKDRDYKDTTRKNSMRAEKAREYNLTWSQSGL